MTRVILAFLMLYLAVFSHAKIEIKMEHVPGMKSKWIRDGSWKNRVAAIKSDFQKSNSKMSLGQYLTNYYDDFYVSKITLGTPPQTFIMRPDTSYGSLWVMDKKCTSKACTGSLTNFNRTLFDSTASSTFSSNSNVNFTHSMYYGYLCSSGIVATDQFNIPGFSPIKQSFGLCEAAEPFIGFHPYDGILGLALPGLRQYDLFTPLENEVSSGNFDKPMFSIWIDGIIGNKYGGIYSKGGLITWGDMDVKNCQFNVHWVPLSSNSYWQFTMSDFSFGSYRMLKTQQVITSTGYTEMGMPSKVIMGWLPLIGGTYDPKRTDYYAPCDTTNYPSMKFNFNGQIYEIPPTEFVDDNNNGTCRVRVFNTDNVMGPKWILSTIFIRNYCIHHDIGNSRIGFSTTLHTMN